MVTLLLNDSLSNWCLYIYNHFLFSKLYFRQTVTQEASIINYEFIMYITGVVKSIPPDLREVQRFKKIN